VTSLGKRHFFKHLVKTEWIAIGLNSFGEEGWDVLGTSTMRDFLRGSGIDWQVIKRLKIEEEARARRVARSFTPTRRKITVLTVDRRL
jgi:hypothetical protein